MEGANDYEFLSRLAVRLRLDLPQVPDLPQLCANGQLLVVPLGGGDPATWANRLAPLQLPEFHLYDREQQPHTQQRQRAIEQVCARAHCQAVLLARRCLENYLHPQAIANAGGAELSFGHDDHVPLLLAQREHELSASALAWDALPYRAQRRYVQHAKRWLNTVAVQQMTAALLAEHDPAGEVLGWYATIAQLVHGCE